MGSRLGVAGGAVDTLDRSAPAVGNMPTAVMALAGGGLLVQADANAFNVLSWVVHRPDRARRLDDSPSVGTYAASPGGHAVSAVCRGRRIAGVEAAATRRFRTGRPHQHDRDAGPPWSTSAGDACILCCTGSGSPTVVLISGWLKPPPVGGWLLSAVARTTTVCVYDRAGQGGATRAEVRRAVSPSRPGSRGWIAHKSQVPLCPQIRPSTAGATQDLWHASRSQVAGVVLLDSHGRAY